MPELPEVETVRQTLRRQILGVTITNIDVLYPNIIKEDVLEFKKKLIGEKLVEIDRKGKFLIFIFENINLLVHLRMEGKFFIKPSKEEIVKHEHIIFKLSNNMDLRYHDTRKFGIMITKQNEELYTTNPLLELGEEPFNMDGKMLYNAIFQSEKPIKEVLLDQHIISGIGNIYADEICFYAKINPRKKCKDLSTSDVDNIIEGARHILSEAIKMGGTTIRSYTSSLGVTGLFQQNLFVHKQENKPCKICNEIIVKTRVGGRGTYYCPKCQELK